MPQTLPEQIDYEGLAFDLALGYDSPEDVALRHNLPLYLVERVQHVPEFRKAMLIAGREITETGKEFKLKARKLSSIVLEELATIALDDEASHSDRIKAISELTKLAGYQRDAELTGVNQAFQVNINLG